MKKLILLIALISLFMIMGVNALVSGDITIQTTTWQENTLVNVTLTNGNNVTYVTLRGSASNTANSSTIVIYNITNSTATNFNFASANFTLGNDIALEDSVSWSITPITTGSQGGADGVSGSATTVTIDRTSPSVATTSHKANTEFDDINTRTITYTVNGANTTSCRIAFGKTRFTGSNTFAMTHSANSCTYTISKGAISDGTYKTYVQASDGTNTSVSTGIDFKIKTIEGVAGDDISAISVPLVEKGVIGQVNLGMVLLIVIVGTGAYLAFFKKK